MTELREPAEIVDAMTRTIERLMVAGDGVRLEAVMRPDGSKWVNLYFEEAGVTHAFDAEFAETLADGLVAPGTDWGAWTPMAQSWARSLRSAVGVINEVGRQ